LHRGARVCAAGHGGQVLLSQPTRDLVDVDARDLASTASRICSSRNGSSSSAARSSRRSRRSTGQTCRCRRRRSLAGSRS
jgi:hypothetical protein